MATIKIIEESSEIYWATTHEGTVEIDGTEVGYRYYEDSNGVEIYIYEEGEGWTTDPSEDLGEIYDTLYDLLTEIAVEELGSEGDEFDFEPEEYND